jgi:hypothetical protein
VRLVENQPCVLGVTCRGIPNDGDDSRVDFFDEAFDPLTAEMLTERQTGEGFSSSGPADCRVRATGACGR